MNVNGSPIRTTTKTLLLALTIGVASASASAAFADELPTATVQDYEAKARVFHDKANGYKLEAAENRKVAKTYREATNAKGRRLNSPEYLRLAADLEKMAKDDEALAKDAERVAAFYERQAAKLKQESR
ncbi:MAG: hypothetical protein SF187_20015 [Deltaproteobacteria bacterium]|nr:hypothetical protein [Deltaproteobacteria bacterium]